MDSRAYFRVQQLTSHLCAPPASAEDTVSAAVKTVNDTFRKGKTRSLQWREQQLRAILRMLSENEKPICEALQKDLRKGFTEVFLTEINMAKQEAALHLRNLKKWTSPQGVPTPVTQLKGLSSCKIQPMPVGPVLIIAPWNYPFQLTLVPVIGAISAGCTMLVKPSEISSNTSALITSLFNKYLDQEAIVVVQGGPEVATACLRHKYGKIFFTGSTSLGKIVYKAAAETLTPVVLELGGKSPCVVDNNVDLDVAVKRIVSGRFMNAGQSCVAPDYVLVDENIHDKFVAACVAQVGTFFGSDPQKSKDFGRVVNGRHLARLSGLLKEAGGAKVETGGLSKVDEKDSYMPPTILTGVSPTSLIMQEEIFGPLLPVLKIKNVDEAISFINARPTPLAAYVFSRSSDVIEKFQNNVLSGGMCANDTIMHLAVPDLPFGGVGDSGFGAYHGKASFDAFSHFKSFLNKTTWFDMDIRYPPFTESKIAKLKKLA